MRAAIPVSISVALLALFGCGKAVPSGSFGGSRPVDSRPGADPVVVAQLARIDLTIDPDGKAVFQKGGVPYDGLVTRSGDTLTFEVLSVVDINIAKHDPALPRSFAFEILPDGSLRHEGVVLRPRAGT